MQLTERRARASHGAVVPHAGGNQHLLRWLLFAVAVIVLVLGAMYMAASLVVTDEATRTEREAIGGSPSDLGLTYEAVSFVSAVDHVRLQGWYLPAGGQRAIIVLHGI